MGMKLSHYSFVTQVGTENLLQVGAYPGSSWEVGKFGSDQWKRTERDCKNLVFKDWLEIEKTDWKSSKYKSSETVLFKELLYSVFKFSVIDPKGRLEPAHGIPQVEGRAGGTTSCWELRRITLLGNEEKRKEVVPSVLTFFEHVLGKDGEKSVRETFGKNGRPIEIIYEYIPFLSPKLVVPQSESALTQESMLTQEFLDLRIDDSLDLKVEDGKHKDCCAIL